MKRFLNIILLALVGVIPALAADVVISGTVISADDNEPLIGATVVVTADELKHAGSTKSNVSTLTDFDGNFTLAVPEGVKSMECRYICYITASVKVDMNTASC